MTVIKPILRFRDKRKEQSTNWGSTNSAPRLPTKHLLARLNPQFIHIVVMGTRRLIIYCCSSQNGQQNASVTLVIRMTSQMSSRIVRVWRNSSSLCDIWPPYRQRCPDGLVMTTTTTTTTISRSTQVQTHAYSNHSRSSQGQLEVMTTHTTSICRCELQRLDSSEVGRLTNTCQLVWWHLACENAHDNIARSTGKYFDNVTSVLVHSTETMEAAWKICTGKDKLGENEWDCCKQKTDSNLV